MDDTATEVVNESAETPAPLSESTLATLSTDFKAAEATVPQVIKAFDDATASQLKSIFTALKVAIPACWDEVVALAKKV